MKSVITKKNAFEFAQMVLGNAICAFSVTCFALPYNMVVSGVSGIGRIINILTGFSVSSAVAVKVRMKRMNQGVFKKRLIKLNGDQDTVFPSELVRYMRIDREDIIRLQIIQSVVYGKTARSG